MKNERNIKKVLISGISGSGGSYLAEYILQNHPTITIHGIARWHSTTTTNNLEKIKDRIFVHECDLNDLSSVFRTLREVKPDAIFHLAATLHVTTGCFRPAQPFYACPGTRNRVITCLVFLFYLFLFLFVLFVSNACVDLQST